MRRCPFKMVVFVSCRIASVFYKENYVTPFQLECPKQGTLMDIRFIVSTRFAWCWSDRYNEACAADLEDADHADCEVFIRKAPYARFDKIRVQSIDKSELGRCGHLHEDDRGGAVQELLEGADL